MRLRIIDKDKVKISMEYDDKYVALHIDHLEFSKDVYIDLLVGVDSLNDFIKTVGYQAMWAVIGASDSKTQRLAERLGFKYLGESPEEEFKGMYVYQYVGREED